MRVLTDRRRDLAALWLASHVLMLATPRTRARVRVALLRARGAYVDESLLQRAEFELLHERTP